LRGGLLIQTSALIVGLLIWPLVFSLPLHISWGWLAFLGLMGAGMYFIYCRALSVGKVQIVVPITSVWALFSAFFGIIFLHESISWHKIVSILIIVSGVILLSVDWRRVKQLGSDVLSSGALEALVVAIGWGIIFFLMGPISRSQGWYFTTLGNRLFIVLGLLALFFTIPGKLDLSPARIPWKLLFWVGVLDTLAFMAYNLAVSRYEVSYVSVVSSASPLVAALLAHFFLKEKISGWQRVGMAAVIGGIILLQI
jgi:transporter family protein